MTTTPTEPITIWMHERLVPAFEEWLEGRGLYLAGPLKTDDDEVYIIGIVGK